MLVVNIVLQRCRLLQVCVGLAAAGARWPHKFATQPGKHGGEVQDGLCRQLLLCPESVS